MKFRILSVITVLAAFAAGPASAQWTGCGLGVSGAEFSGLVTNGGPAGIGTQGPRAGALVNCDYKVQAFVIGAEASKTWSFGDLKTLGINDDLTIMGRVGVLFTSSSLLYGHVDWTRVNLSGAPFSNIDGWKVGLGNEFRIPNSPMYADLRYSHVFFDNKNLWPSAKAEADEFMFALKLKLGPGAFGGKGDLIDSGEPKPAKHCDPKMANC